MFFSIFTIKVIYSGLKSFNFNFSAKIHVSSYLNYHELEGIFNVIKIRKIKACFLAEIIELSFIKG